MSPKTQKNTKTIIVGEGRGFDRIRRITGYLVKKSDIAKLDAGIAVQQANATWGLGEVRNSRILERKVRSLE